MDEREKALARFREKPSFIGVVVYMHPHASSYELRQGTQNFEKL